MNNVNPAKKTGWLTDDLIIGLAIIGFGISILVQVPGTYGDVMLFPTIVAIVCLVSGAIIVGMNFIRPTTDPTRNFRTEAYCNAISVFLFIMMALAEQLGFFFCLFVICFVINQCIALFCRERGSKSIVRSLVMSIIMCACTFIVFRVLLGILTPEGFLI